MSQLSGKKILVLVSNGVEEAVMSNVQRELLKTGAAVKTVGTEPGLVNSWNASANSWGLYFPVDQQIGQTLGADFDALIVPCGSRGIQKLAGNPHSERILASFLTSEKPVVLMGDAVELLAKTGLAKDWPVAGPEKLQATMEAAGAVWKGTDVNVQSFMMTGDVTDVLTFVQSMITHVAQEQNVRAAA